MVGRRRCTNVMGMAALLALVVPQTANGWGWYPAYYPCGSVYPAPYFPATALVRPAPALNERAIPRTTGEPPQNGKRAPIITESRAYKESEPQQTGNNSGRLLVGFWNITGRDVTLTIDGQARKLGKDRAITVELDRQFTWHIDDSSKHSENVPEAKQRFEVIIRPERTPH